MNIEWEERDGIIFFQLVSLRKTGKEWLSYFEKHHIPASRHAREMLLSPDFAATVSKAGYVYQVRIMKGNSVPDRKRTTRLIGQRAHWLIPDVLTPSAEVSPLIRAAFSDTEIKAMGFEEIVTFHFPINGRFLDIDTETGKLESAPAGPNDTWHKEHGFAFIQ